MMYIDDQGDLTGPVTVQNQPRPFTASVGNQNHSLRQSSEVQLHPYPYHNAELIGSGSLSENRIRRQSDPSKAIHISINNQSLFSYLQELSYRINVAFHRFLDELFSLVITIVFFPFYIIY